MSDGIHSQAGIDRVARQLSELSDRAARLLDQLKEQQGDSAAELRERASRTLSDTRRRLAKARPEAQEAASEAVRVTLTFVRRHPGKALAVGALLLAAVGIAFYTSDTGDR